MRLAKWRPSRVFAERPDVKRDDIHVLFDDGALSIEGERHYETVSAGERRYYQKTMLGSFFRAITLPGRIDACGTALIAMGGVLTIVKPGSVHPSTQLIDIEVN